MAKSEIRRHMMVQLTMGRLLNLWDLVDSERGFAKYDQPLARKARRFDCPEMELTVALRVRDIFYPGIHSKVILWSDGKLEIR